MFGLFDDFDRQDVKEFLNTGVDYAADLGGDIYEGANDIYDSISRGTAYDDFTNYLGGLFDDDPVPTGYAQEGRLAFDPTAEDRAESDRRRLQAFDPTAEAMSLRDAPMSQRMVYENRRRNAPPPEMLGVLADANELAPRPRVIPTNWNSSMLEPSSDEEAPDLTFMRTTLMRRPEESMYRLMSRFIPEEAKIQPIPERVDANGERFAPTVDDINDPRKFLDSTVRDRVKRGQNLITRQKAVDRGLL